ncbi:MAG: radical SAM protein [Caldiserica bacterium]|nr:MAG: radical SAM protein [Caldisericota bacterium]
MKKNFKFVYGPVPSRRFGRSLGVNPIPLKTCNYSCVYCQLGRTKNFINERRSFFKKDLILSEIKEAVNEFNNEIDYITFVGEGEPLLSKDIGYLIQKVREFTDIKTALITNGALLMHEEVRREVIPFHVISPTLDAGSEEIFRLINRPFEGIKLADIVNGFINLRKEYKGEIWIEIMLVKGLNDKEEELLKIKNFLEKISPDKVYVNVPIRPPAEEWVKIPSEKEIEKAKRILKNAIFINLEEQGIFEGREFGTPEEAILFLTRRHPLRIDQILKSIKGFERDKLLNSLNRLLKQGRVKKIKYRGKEFYLPSESEFD